MEITVDRSLRLWWVFIVRGILFILLGVYLFAAPVSGLLALSFLFGLAIFLTGISELLRSYKDHGAGNRGWHLFVGLVDLLLGVILMSHLVATMTILRFVIGFYFLFKGVTLLTFRRHAANPAVLVLGAIVILLFVGMIWFNPAFGTMTILIWTALAFLVTGVLNVMLGLRMKPRV